MRTVSAPFRVDGFQLVEPGVATVTLCGPVEWVQRMCPIAAEVRICSDGPDEPVRHIRAGREVDLLHGELRSANALMEHAVTTCERLLREAGIELEVGENVITAGMPRLVRKLQDELYVARAKLADLVVR